MADVIWVSGSPMIVEIADTRQKQYEGLSKRGYMPRDWGMLFPFQEGETQKKFVMRDTEIPLDIGFVDRFGNIVEIRSMEPNDNRGVKNRRRAGYAIEANKGWFEENGVEEGDGVYLPEFNEKAVVSPDGTVLRDTDVEEKIGQDRRIADHGDIIRTFSEYFSDGGRMTDPRQSAMRRGGIKITDDGNRVLAEVNVKGVTESAFQSVQEEVSEKRKFDEVFVRDDISSDIVIFDRKDFLNLESVDALKASLKGKEAIV